MVLRQLSPAVRDRLIDGTSVLLSLAAASAVFLTSHGWVAPDGWTWWVDAVGGLGSSALLLVRRRRPLLAAAVLVVLMAFAITTSIASGIMLLTLVIHCRLRYALGYTLASVLLAEVPEVLRGKPETFTSLWQSALLVFVASSVLIAWGVAVRSRRALLASLVERAERAEAEQRLRAEAIRQAERARIAREMHDVLAHRIALLNMHAGALAHRRHTSHEETARAAEVIRGTAREAMQDLRVLLGVLRSPDGVGDEPAPDDAGAAPQPRLTDLDALLADLRAAGMDIDTRVDVADLAAVPELSARTLYRIAQEALTNAAKHGDAAPVALRLSGKPGAGVLLEVTNPAVTNPAEAGRGNGLPGGGKGLVGIRERVTLAGGELLHCGAEPAGAAHRRFRVAVRLPWAR